MADALELALRQRDYWLTNYRRTWKGSVFSAFLTPLLYVVAMGVVLGGFVRVDPSRLDGATSYLAFVAPGLLAAQSMQTAVGETTYAVYSRTTWDRVYFAMNATPLRPLDIVNAHLGYLAVRLALTSLVFTAVLAPFGVFASVPAAIGAWLGSLLVGAAIGVPIYAFSAGARSEAMFALIFRLAVIPQFLFSGAFFPVANLSPALEAIARVTPLYQGVDLTRMLALGTWSTGPALVHLAYQVVLIVVGHRIAVRRLAKKLAY